LDRKDILIIILVAVLVGPLILTGYTISQQTGIGGGGAGTIPDWVNEQGGGVEACSYLIYPESSNYYAKNQQPGSNRGRNQFSGTNPATVIQNALDSGTGGICLRRGTYTFTGFTGSGSTSYILTMGDNDWLIGEDREDTVLILSTNALPSQASFVEYNFIRNSDQANGNTNIQIRDLTIDGNGANQNSVESQVRLVLFAGVKDSLISNVVMKRAYGITLGFTRVTGAADAIPSLGSTQYNRGVIVEDSIFDTNYATPGGVNPDLGPMGGGIYDSIIRDIIVRNSVGAGTTLRYGRNMLYSGIIAYSNGIDGIRMEGGREITITDSVSHSNGGTGIYIVTPIGNGFNIIGNSAIANTADGIRVLDAHTEISITSNIARDNTGNGISFFNDEAKTVTYPLVADNLSLDNTGDDFLTNSFTTLSTGIFSNNIGRTGKWNFAGSMSFMRFWNNQGFVTENRGSTSVADGGTISHGLFATPTSVTCSTSVAGEFCSVTALAATTFTVAIRKHDGTAGTTQAIYWWAIYVP